MVGQLPNISTTFNLDPVESKFVSLDNVTYILDTDFVYIIDIKEQGPTTSLNLTKVEGYAPLSEYGELIRVVAKTENTFVVLSNEAVTEYVCPRPTSCNKRPVVT